MSQNFINYFNSLSIINTEETDYWKVLNKVVKNPDCELMSFHRSITFDTLLIDTQLYYDENGHIYIQYLLERDCDLINNFKINILSLDATLCSKLDTIFNVELVIANKKIPLESDQLINMVASLCTPIYIRFTLKELIQFKFSLQYTSYIAETKVRRNLRPKDGEELVTGKIHYDSNLSGYIM